MQLLLMRILSRSRFISLALIALTLSLSGIGRAQVIRTPLPVRLSDADFWALVTSSSEPDGYFSQDNWTSNEMDSPVIVHLLAAGGVTDGAYLGVGPEQNFTYVAAIRPRIAFIVDIRRQSILQHLMYKAIFELSPDRADFASLLFSRRRPAGLDSTTTIERFWEAFLPGSGDRATYDVNLARILNHLRRTHGFDLSAADVSGIQASYNQFFMHGPRIGYLGSRGFQEGTRAATGPGLIRAKAVQHYGGVNFAALTASPDDGGIARSFLTSEDRYRVVRDLHLRNLFIPIVGDFAGPKAIRAVGQYLRDHETPLAAFYLSNVEDYLWRAPGVPGPSTKWQQFYPNVATLPTTAKSMFIRYSVADGSSLCLIEPFLAAFNAGRVTMPQHAFGCTR
jgi:hypothetical protein